MIAAFALSVILGGVVTSIIWWVLHGIVDRTAQATAKKPERVFWIPLVVGVVERILITTMVGWSVGASGAFIATWILIKALGGWSRLKGESPYFRSVYSVGLICSAISALFAVAGGLLVRQVVN